jgi:hypothetical protein
MALAHAAAACAGFCPRWRARGLRILPKLGHSRRQCRLHDGGIDSPRGVFGLNRMLRPSGGIFRRGETRKLADKQIVQRR